MTKTLLDTDLLSEVLRRRNAQVQEHAVAYLKDHERYTVSAVTMFEVTRGWHHAGRIERADAFLEWAADHVHVLPFDAECAKVAGRIGGTLLKNGTPIGLADVLIAATAIVHGLPIATGTRRITNAPSRSVCSAWKTGASSSGRADPMPTAASRTGEALFTNRAR